MIVYAFLAAGVGVAVLGRVGAAVGLVGLVVLGGVALARRRVSDADESCCPPVAPEGDQMPAAMKEPSTTRPLVEVLYFQGCPNYADALAMVQQVRDELGIDADIRLREVTSLQAAAEGRFLGSPTIQVNGHDVEPDAAARRDYTLACRVYRSHDRLAGQPDAQLVRRALTEAMNSP
jgi:hypothetical protein